MFFVCSEVCKLEQEKKADLGPELQWAGESLALQWLIYIVAYEKPKCLLRFSSLPLSLTLEMKKLLVTLKNILVLN